MPSHSVPEAKSNFSRLLKRTEQGEQVILMRDGRPLAELVPFVEQPGAKGKLGWAAGLVVETDGWEKAMSDEEVKELLGRKL